MTTTTTTTTTQSLFSNQTTQRFKQTTVKLLKRENSFRPREYTFVKVLQNCKQAKLESDINKEEI